jgi:hypothetical protein
LHTTEADYTIQLNGTEVLTLWQGTGSPANGYGDGRVSVVCLHRGRELTASCMQAIILNSTLHVLCGLGAFLIVRCVGTYDVIYNFTTNLPSGTDIHEFQIPTVNTPKVPAGSSALVTSYLATPGNLSAVGGTGNDWFAECYLEEYVVTLHYVRLYPCIDCNTGSTSRPAKFYSSGSKSTSRFLLVVMLMACTSASSHVNFADSYLNYPGTSSSSNRTSL